MNYKGIDKEKILEVQKVKLHNTDAYAMFTESELKEICKGTGSFERLYKGIENQLKARMNDTEMAIICEMAMMYLNSLKDKEAADKETYNKGLNDAWELAKKIIRMYSKSEKGVFGNYCTPVTENYANLLLNVMLVHSPQEALSKLEAYEKEQAEIKVGDVVVPKAGKYKEKEQGVVIGLYDKDDISRISVIHKDKNGNIENTYYHKESLIKTGKHIDIHKILDELKEGTE